MRVLTLDGLQVKGIPYTRGHIARLVKASKFPKPVKLGASCNVWLEDEIDAYLKAKIAERDRETA